MATKETAAKVKGLFYKAQNKMEYLYTRWLDEHEYEDINTYDYPLQSLFEEFGATLVKMNKRPFGFTCSIDGFKFRYSMSGSNYEVKEL